MNQRAEVKYDGKPWKIYYYDIDTLRIDLPGFGRFLDSIEEKGEKVCTIVTNIGITKGSLFQARGVKAFAVFARKEAESIG